MTKFTKYITLLIFISVSTLAISNKKEQTDSISKHLQQRIIDSEHIDSTTSHAIKLLKHAKIINNDSLLIRTHQNLGDEYRQNNQSDSAIYHYNTALKLAEKIDKPYFISRAHILIGIYYSSQSKLEKAKPHYQTATESSREPDKQNSKAFVKNKIYAFNKLGNIYREQGYLKKALQAFLNANTIVEENDINDERINSLINIANVYSADEQWGKALTKQNEILKFAKENKDIYSQAIANNNIGTIYESLNEYNKALIHYLKSLQLRKSGDITRGLSTNYHNLGSINYRLGDYKQAIYFLNTSLTIAQENNSKVDYIHNYEYLSKVYIKTKEYSKAESFLSKARALAEERNLSKKKLDLAKLQTEYYFEIGKLDLAQKAFTEYDSLRTNFSENEKSKKIIQMQTLYETEKKEKENDLLKTQNQLSKLNLEKEIESKNQIVIGLGFALLLLIIIIFLLRNRTIANKVNKEINIRLEESNGKLQVINSTKDKFFSIIAHDLRSPLGAILSFSNLIDNESNTSKEIEIIAEYNTLLNQSARNLNSLLENLLQWAKSQLGSINYSVVACDLSDIVQDNIEVQKLKAKGKSIEITTKLDANIQVYADINMLNTVIRNLLNNAIKFSFPKSEIIISHKIKENMIHLSIQDHGMGISQTQQEKLFNIDSNESTLGTNNETGTGLGLILCKEFVEKNGGTIWIESKEGKGSVFTFTIPLQDS